MLEEVLDLFALVLRDVVDVLDVVPARVLRGDRDDLGVAAAVIRHVEHADDAHAHADAGEQRVLAEHQHVDRVAVEAEGVLEVAVVRRVGHRRVEHAIEHDATGLVVDLVLVAAALRHLDGDVVVLGHILGLSSQVVLALR